MFCPRCGSQNLDTAKFCAKCGAPLSAPATPRQAMSPDVRQQAPWNQGMPAQGMPAQAAPAQGTPASPASSPWNKGDARPVSNMGGGAVLSQGTGDLTRMALGATDALLALALTFAPWIEVDAPWFGTYGMSLPSTALQLMNRASDLRSLTNFLGVSDSEPHAVFVALGMAFIALWLVPVACLVISSVLDLSGRRGGAVGGVALAVSALVSAALVFAFVAHLGHELNGYVDVGRFIHVTPWVWAGLVVGTGLAIAHARLLPRR